MRHFCSLWFGIAKQVGTTTFPDVSKTFLPNVFQNDVKIFPTTTNPTTATAKASTLLSVPAKSADNGSRQRASSTIFPKQMFYQTSSVSVLSLVLVKRLRNGNKHSACFIPYVTSCYSCWVRQIHVSVSSFDVAVAP